MVLFVLVFLGSTFLPSSVAVRAAETTLGNPITTGVSPVSAAANPTTNRIYVTNQGSNSVSVLDGRTNVKLGDISIGPGLSLRGVAVNPTTNVVYVAAFATNTIYLINGGAGSFGELSPTTISTAALGAGPTGVAVNPTTNTIYVAAQTAAKLLVINGISNTITANPDSGTGPVAVSVNPTTNKVYVADSSGSAVNVHAGADGSLITSIATAAAASDVAVNAVSNMVYAAHAGGVLVINGASDSMATEIGVPNSPVGVAVNTSSNRVYVTRAGANAVSMIDGVVNVLDGAAIPVGASPSGVAVNPSSGFAYVANNGAGTVSVLGVPFIADVAAGSVDAGSNEVGVDVNAYTNRVYVANQSGNTVAVLDAKTLQPVAGSPITVPGQPVGVAVDQTTNLIWVTQYAGNSVTVIDGTTNTVRGTIPLGAATGPVSVAVDAARQRVYIANQLKNSVTVLDGVQGTTLATITSGIGNFPSSIAVNVVTRRIYVANVFSGTVSVISGETNAVIGTPISIGATPVGVTTNPITGQLAVAHITGLSQFNTNGDANNLAATTSTGKGPIAVTVNPVSNRIYVANANGGVGNDITVIDGATNTVLGAPLPVGTVPAGLAVSSATGRLYATAPLGSSGLLAFEPDFHSSTQVAPPGSTVQMTWGGLFGAAGSDKIGLFETGAANTSPIVSRFTNGTQSAGSVGVASGSLNLPLPGNLTPGVYHIRMVSGINGATLGLVAVSVPAAPVAVNDTYTMQFGAPLVVVAASGVLANDTDTDTAAASLQASVVSPPQQGLLDLQPSGAFSYTGKSTFSGTDTFTYRVTDPTGLSSTATVSITVNAVTCGPRSTVQLTNGISGGALHSTIRASDSGGLTGNRIQSITFGTMQNATATLNGQAVTSGQTVAMPAGTTQASLTVRRVTPGQATTVPFTVTDSCGAWPTFVGGGPSAGF